MNRNHNVGADVCEKCGGSSEVLKKIRIAGFASRRYHRCRNCKGRFRTVERREIAGTSALRYGPNWATIAAEIRKRDKNTCQVCFQERGFNFPVDHIIPFRISGCNDRGNLLLLGPVCHAAKKKAEDLLKTGNRLGFESQLRCLGWDMARVAEAFRAWGET